MQKTTKTIYITSDKQEFSTETEAQAHEIDMIAMDDVTGPTKQNTETPWVPPGGWIVRKKDAILAILGARRKPRSDKGKKRQKAEVAA